MTATAAYLLGLATLPALGVIAVVLVYGIWRLLDWRWKQAQTDAAIRMFARHIAESEERETLQ